MPTAFPIAGRVLDQGRPVNRGHPLCRGLLGWWRSMPAAPAASGWGSRTLRDLLRLSDGTLVNGPAWVGGRGPSAGSLSFDGSSTYVTAPLAFSLGDATAAVWVYPRSAAVPYARAIDADYRAGFWVGRNGTTSTFGGAFYSNDESPFGSFAAVAENAWNLVVVVRSSGTSTATVFNDAAPAGSSGSGFTPSVNGTAAGSAVAFGQNRTTNPGADNLDGRADDFALWDRALSADELLAWYAQSVRGHPDTLNWLAPRWADLAAGAPPPGSAAVWLLKA